MIFALLMCTFSFTTMIIYDKNSFLNVKAIQDYIIQFPTQFFILFIIIECILDWFRRRVVGMQSHTTYGNHP
jgi:hypothetical protein